MRDGIADTVFIGGRVFTVDEEFTVSSAVAVANGRILAVADDATIRELIGPSTQVVELGGRAVLPGINDAHLHLAMFGQAGVDLTSVTSVASLQRKLRSALDELADGKWLIGDGWREVNIPEFAGPAGPHHRVLDVVTGERPALLNHASRHSVLVNSAALRIAGIDRSTPDPAGGLIVRDSDGEPTGMLQEAAVGLVGSHIPPHTAAERQNAITSAMRTLNSLGITSVTDPIVWPELLRDYIAVHQQHRMTVRVNTLLHWGWPSPVSSVEGVSAALGYAGLSSGLGDDWLRVGGVKLFADGIPSQGTAWLSQPYADGGHGHLVTPGADDAARYTELLDVIELVHRHRLQAQVHVTGDRAADAAIDGIIRAQDRDPWPDARHALLHGTLLSEESFVRLAAHDIGVITSSMMKSHTGGSISRTIGADRWANAFPAGALLKAGVRVADSSDAPVTYPQWQRGLATFVGAAPDPLGEVPPDLRLTREQAIRLWTLSPAYFEHADCRKGSIVAGHLADLVVLDQDPMAVEAHELHSLTVTLTMVGGQVVHEMP